MGQEGEDPRPGRVASDWRPPLPVCPPPTLETWPWRPTCAICCQAGLWSPSLGCCLPAKLGWYPAGCASWGPRRCWVTNLCQVALVKLTLALLTTQSCSVLKPIRRGLFHPDDLPCSPLPCTLKASSGIKDLAFPFPFGTPSKSPELSPASPGSILSATPAVLCLLYLLVGPSQPSLRSRP